MQGRRTSTQSTVDPATLFDHFVQLYSGKHHDHFDYAAKLANAIRAERLANQADPSDPHLLHDHCTAKDIEAVKFDLLKGMGTSAGLDRVRKRALFWIDNEDIAALFNCILDTGDIPAPWLQASLVCLPKQGKVIDAADNVRGIAIQSCFLKMFTNFLAKRLFKWASDNKVVRDSQNAYKPGHRGTNNVFVLRTAIEKASVAKLPLYVAYVDLRKAFDLVDRNTLWAQLAAHGATGRLFRLMRTLYDKLTFRVTLGGRYSAPLSPATGVLQGDSLSPLLFIIYLSALRTTPHTDDVLLDGRRVHDLLHADDVLLMSHSATGLQHHLNAVQQFCSSMLAVPNTSKTFVQCLTRNEAIDAASASGIVLNGEPIAWSTRQKYVGMTIDMRKPLQWLSQINATCKRMQVAIGQYYSLSKRLGHTSQLYSINHFKTFIRPHLDYGAELMFDLADYKRKDFEKIVKDFLRRILQLPPNSLIPPLYMETGLQDVQHRWLSLTASFLHSAQKLPDSHPARYALADSIKRRSSKRGFVARYLACLSDLGELVASPFTGDTLPDIWCDTTVSFIRLHMAAAMKDAMSSKQLAPFYKEVRWTGAPMLYLRHPDERGRAALTRLRTGHSHLRYRVSLQDTRVEGTPRDQSCRLCSAPREDEMHIFFDCPGYNGEIAETQKHFFAALEELGNQGLIDLPDGYTDEVITPAHLSQLFNSNNRSHQSDCSNGRQTQQALRISRPAQGTQEA